jgi:hypothetical protein
MLFTQSIKGTNASKSKDEHIKHKIIKLKSDVKTPGIANCNFEALISWFLIQDFDLGDVSCSYISVKLRQHSCLRQFKSKPSCHIQ